MTATHEGYHAFTASTWLVAKEPDHLTTCNTVEPERLLFAQSQPCRIRSENLQEGDSRANKHRTQHLLFSRIGDFHSHFEELWRSRSGNAAASTNARWNQFQDLHYIREQIRAIYEKIRNHRTTKCVTVAILWQYPQNNLVQKNLKYIQVEYTYI